MNPQTRIIRFLLLVPFTLVSFAATPLCRAQSLGGTVDAGYDLFQTAPGTFFTDPNTMTPIPLIGDPLGSYNFGAGAQNVGNTDTIVQRLGTANFANGNPAANMDTIPIQLVALQLQTPVAVNGHFLFVTLQSTDMTGPASTGMMTIDFPAGATSAGGTFTSFFDVFFDVHIDSPTGAIVNSGSLMLTNGGSTWMHDPIPGEVLIDGVNNNLNGMNHNADFNAPFISEMETGAVHNVQLALVPEPSTWLGAGLALSAILVSRLRTRSRAGGAGLTRLVRRN
jgi:hypothetical protein